MYHNNGHTHARVYYTGIYIEKCRESYREQVKKSLWYFAPVINRDCYRFWLGVYAKKFLAHHDYTRTIIQHKLFTRRSDFENTS